MFDSNECLMLPELITMIGTLFLLAQVLATNAASMQPGTWKQIHATNQAGYTRALFTDLCNSSSGIGSYKDRIQWDPNTKAVWFTGADAGSNLSCGKVLKYEENVDLWSAAVPSIRSVLSPLGITSITHNYEQADFDPVT